MARGFPSPEEFVEVWETSETLFEVSARLLSKGFFRMSLKVARRWARTYRESGVDLKPLRSVRLVG